MERQRLTCRHPPGTMGRDGREGVSDVRKLPWFAGGFALACLLLAGDVPLVWPALSAVGMLAGWQVTHPRNREEWVAMSARFPCRRLLWQICRRGTALALGCGVGLCWFCVYYYVVCVPTQTWVGEQTVSGTVMTQPQQTDTGRYSMVLRLDGGPEVNFYAPDTWAQVQLGDRVQASGQVEAVSLTDGDELSYYASKGIFLLGSCQEAPMVGPAAVLPLACWPGWAAQRLKEGIQRAFDGQVSPLAVAVTLGDRSGLEDGVYQDMTRAGVLHAAVVSGLHISFLVGVLMLLCRGNRRWGLVMLPVLLFYAVMAGGTPSAFRAVWMQGAVLAVPWVGREQDSPSALALALLVLLIQNPFCVFSVGLQLSFLSVAGILVLTPRVYACLMKPAEGWKRAGWTRLVRRIWRGVCASVSASLGAMALTIPLMGAVFGQVSLVAPVTNILVLWAMTALMICALAVGVLALFVPGVAALLGQGAGLLGHYTLWVVHRMGTVPLGVLDTENPYHVVWLVGAYLVGALLLWCGVTAVRALVAGVGLAVLLALPVGLSALTVANSDLTVAGLDVGQGSATLLLSPRCSVLVDCGGSASASAGDIAGDYLAGMGRTKLDALVLTHLDDDHFNGVERLLDRVEVEQVVAPVSARGEKSAQQLEGWLEEREIPIRWVEEETRLSLEGVELTLFPPLGSGTTNEEGLFVLGTAGEFDVLITGDADEYVEKMLVKYFTIPDIELLVVGHHGSASSTCMELLARTSPELGIISVEEDNSYGHPDPDTLERLRRAGVEVHRTDLEGTVTVAVRGEAVGIW